MVATSGIDCEQPFATKSSGVEDVWQREPDTSATVYDLEVQGRSRGQLKRKGAPWNMDETFV